MDRGTYAAASGGLRFLRMLDVVTQNVANINTPGFKQEYLVNTTQGFQNTLASSLKTDNYAQGDHQRTPGTLTVESRTDFNLGAMHQTDSPLDAALARPNDFFVVNSTGGSTYTRAGNFHLDTTGRLVTSDGTPVSGDGGEIIVGASGAYITPSGQVRNKQQVFGQLQVVRIESPEMMIRESGSRFKMPNNAEAPAVLPEIIPQTIERANISVSSAMVDLISAHRGFQMYTKIAETVDRLNDQANNRIGRAAS
jgi:flagellar basal-body rod protein FlgF